MMKKKKNLLAGTIGGALLLVLAGCAPTGSLDDVSNGTSSVPGMEQEQQSSPAISTGSLQPTSSEDAATVIPLQATNFVFTPSEIRVKQGQKVRLQLASIEGVHGIAVPELGINVRMEPGKTTEIDLPTTKAGTYRFVCSVPCGPGHKDMVGQIIIE